MNTGRIVVSVGDITALDVDVMVNAANSRLAPGAGVCGAIFAAAGQGLEEACAAVAPCPDGEARITPGFGSRAKWIVHAVGPIWEGGEYGEDDMLASAYTAALRLAESVDARSIAFPSISTGVFGFPVERAARIAMHTLVAWADVHQSPDRIELRAYSRADGEMYQRAFEEQLPRVA